MAQPAFFLRLAELAESEEDAKKRTALEQLAIQVIIWVVHLPLFSSCILHSYLFCVVCVFFFSWARLDLLVCISSSQG